MLEDEFIRANIRHFFEKQLPSHGVGADDVGDGHVAELILEEDERTWHAWVRAHIEWNHLERDVRELGYLDEMPELGPHDRRAGNLTTECGFVDDAPAGVSAMNGRRRPPWKDSCAEPVVIAAVSDHGLAS